MLVNGLPFMASVSRRLLHYITSDRSEVNPYNFCVANRTVDGHQHTRGWHVDDLKSRHVNPNNFTKAYVQDIFEYK